MPLPMKTASEASALLGIPEKELRAMIDLGKIRAVMRNGVPRIAPDEIAKLAKQRKTLPESGKK